MKDIKSYILNKLPFTILAFLVLAIPFQAFFLTWANRIFAFDQRALFIISLWKELLILLLAIVLIYRVIVEKGTKLKLLTVDKFIIAFFILILLYSVLFGGNLAQKLAGLRYDFEYFFLYVVARILGVTKEHVKKLLFLFIYLSIPVILFGLMQINYIKPSFMEYFGYARNLEESSATGIISTFQSINPSLPGVYRVQSTFPGAIQFGSYLVLIFSICLGLIFKYIKNKGRFLLFSSIGALSLYALYSTHTRSAWIGAAAVILLIIFSIVENKKILLIVTGLVAAVLAILTFFFFNNPKFQTILLHGEIREGGLFGSTQAHWEAFANNVKLAIANPLGHGLGYAGPASKYGTEPIITENWFLQIMLELGIIGLGLFVAITFKFISMLKDIFKKSKDSFEGYLALSLAAALIGVSVSSLFLHTFADTATIYPLFIFSGIIISLNANNADIINTKEKK